MKPHDVFGIIVRMFGLSLTVYAIWYLLYGFATMAGLPQNQAGIGVSFFISGGMFLVVGLYLLRGAPALMRYAYPTSNKTNND